ncbi:hypothetical protein [Mesorhizobium sp. M0488]|uniref:hypothetical protein n=1 Tax=unclassified Mesorhizobium TaxID=325217 RepID=UPI00333E06BF
MRIDLAVHGLIQAGTIGRPICHDLVFRLRDLAVEPAARQLGVERFLLCLHLLVALGDSGKLIAKTLHRPAHGRSLGIGDNVAGIDPALGQLERNDRHLFGSCHGRATPESQRRSARAGDAARCCLRRFMNVG